MTGHSGQTSSKPYADPVEAARLRELHALEILGTAAAPEFDRICEIARDAFGVPTVLVSLVDRDRHWFKARRGFDRDSIPRDHGFCGRTIAGDDVFVVEDAAADPVHAANPVVAATPHVRFYAGAPLILKPGIRIGALCLVDTKPRSMSPAERAQLARLAGVVVDEILLHDASRRAARELTGRIAAQRRLEAQTTELRRRQEVLTRTEQLAHVGGWQLGLDCGELTWSDEMYRICELPVADGPVSAAALGLFNREVRIRILKAIEIARRADAPFELELPFETAHGNARWGRVAGEIERQPGRPDRVIGILQDITERWTAEQRIWHAAHHDVLTELPNRALFQQRLDQLLNEGRRHDGRVALLMLDLDHFKDINDTVGHDVGDEMLRTVGRRLRDSVRDTDMVARLGGDEFAIVLPKIESTEEALAIIERLQAALREPVHHDGHVFDCSASIGVTMFPEHGTGAEELLKNADIALYLAKSLGRGRIAVYASEMRRAMEERVDLGRMVRGGLARDEFVPFYQPKICLASGRAIGFEALIRWKHASRGLLTPGAFAAAFEDQELALALGERVLACVTADLARWHADGVDVGRVAVNMSAAEFHGPDLADRVLRQLAASGVSARSLTVEVTETVLLDRRTDAIKAALESLHQAGVVIALDDFGTGFASLTHLKQFPVDLIKIDQSFVRDLTTDPNDAAIVNALIGLGHNLDIQLVAEGVETREQADYLRRHGCDIGQGYYFAKPMPASRVAHFVRTWAPHKAGLTAADDLDLPRSA